MALHELTTNAAKYGALSQPDGRLSVSWCLKGGKLALKWVEAGVNLPATRRMKQGFGTDLIEHGIGRNLGGDTQIDFNEDGLTVAITISLDGQSIDEPPVATAVASGG